MSLRNWIVNLATCATFVFGALITFHNTAVARNCGVTMELAVSPASMKIGSPFVVNVTITNVGHDEVGYYIGGSDEAEYSYLFSPVGASIIKVNSGEVDGSHMQAVISPGESIIDNLNLNDVDSSYETGTKLAMNPGRYRLAVTRYFGPVHASFFEHPKNKVCKVQSNYIDIVMYK